MKKNVLKTIPALILMLALLLSCVSAPAEGPAPGGQVAGGWAAAQDTAVTDEIAAKVARALEGLVGVNYEPVMYLGSQVVAGTNHAVLCRATVVVPDAVPFWAVLYLYEDLEGNVTVMKIEPLALNAQTEE